MAKSNLHEAGRHDFSGRRGWIVGIAIATVLCIAPAAVFIPYFQWWSILYAIPLTLLAVSGQLRAMRWLTLVIIALAFITYFLRYWLEPPATGPQFLSFRIINRLIEVCMLGLLSKVFSIWLTVDRYWHDPLSSDEFKFIAMPYVVIIALVDALTPSYINLSILYLVPLVACAFVRSDRLLWTMCVLLQVLAIVGVFWGPQPSGEDTYQHLFISGVLNVATMLVVANLLHYWIRTPRQGAQVPLAETPRPATPSAGGI
jgi:hypothetical protein